MKIDLKEFVVAWQKAKSPDDLKVFGISNAYASQIARRLRLRGVTGLKKFRNEWGKANLAELIKLADQNK